MENTVRGKVYLLKDNIDTDQIIPAMHLVYKMDTSEESKLYGKYALSGVPTADVNGVPFIKEGEFESEYSIIVSGKNFGCGSSREHAPYALQKAGVKIVIAEDYARIFYRNAVDGGFVIPFETPVRLVDEVKMGDVVEVDVVNCKLTNISQGKEYKLNPLGDVQEIIEAGGLFNFARTKGYIK